MPTTNTIEIAAHRRKNFGIVAHVDAGKTTTTEKILFSAGVIRRPGEVDDGTTTTDWMVQEQKRGISIVAAAISVPWREHLLHIIDTPGHVDFSMEVERSLRAVDGVVALFSAVEGVEPQSEAVWRAASSMALPRLAFINKCDREGANWPAAVDQIRQRLQANPLIVQRLVPQPDNSFVVEDLIEPAEATPERDLLLEQVAELDDEFCSLYLAGTVNANALRSAIRRLTLASKAVPVLFGSAKRSIGITELLDAVVDYLPNADQHSLFQASDSADVIALVWKIMRSERGRTAIVRVFGGKVKQGQALLSTRNGDIVVASTLLEVHSNSTEEVSFLASGSIGAIVHPSVANGDVLVGSERQLTIPSMTIPPPVLAIAIELVRADDAGKLQLALAELIDEDPSLRLGIDIESGRTLLYGVGELHLEIAVARLREEFGLECLVGQAAVAYREVIAKPAQAEFVHTRSVGGRGEYAAVVAEVSPLAGGTGCRVEVSAAEESVPAPFRDACIAGAYEALERGVLRGYPIADALVSITGGKSHPVDSCNAAYKNAAYRATVAALLEAEPAVHEPVMAVEVVTPDDSVGDVVADLHARRGKITGIAARPGVQTCACFVPMASMFRYSTELRSKTRGRATCTIRFDHYQPVPKHLLSL